MNRKKGIRSKLYTRKGDLGETNVLDSCRVGKDDLTIAALGNLDELNAAIGIVLSHRLSKQVISILDRIQRELFDVGCMLLRGESSFDDTYIERLEQEIEAMESKLPRLTGFILPRGSSAAAHCHLARTICRRTERSLVAVFKREPFNPTILAYINRLSDLLFVIARSCPLSSSQ